VCINARIILPHGRWRYVPNFASDILVNVVRTKIPLISISLSSLVLIFVLVLVSSTIIQNVFVIFVIVFVIVDEKNTASRFTHLREIIAVNGGTFLSTRLH